MEPQKQGEIARIKSPLLTSESSCIFPEYPSSCFFLLYLEYCISEMLWMYLDQQRIKWESGPDTVYFLLWLELFFYCGFFFFFFFLISSTFCFLPPALDISLSITCIYQILDVLISLCSSQSLGNTKGKLFRRMNALRSRIGKQPENCCSERQVVDRRPWTFYRKTQEARFLLSSTQVAGRWSRLLI